MPKKQLPAFHAPQFDDTRAWILIARRATAFISNFRLRQPTPLVPSWSLLVVVLVVV
jgi:hypothetical protein